MRLSVLIACILTLLANPKSYGFGLFSSTTTASGFSEIVGSPNDHWWYDLNTITYAFDPSFDTLFPNPRIKDQVRLAFQQWDNAWSTANGAIYTYNRANGFQPFVDIRSVTVHEIGHTLGLGHPNQAAAAGRNYRPSGGGFAAQADQGTELMRSWINQGDYNHVLSHDELDGYRFVYGTRNLNFTEVSSTAAANIVIRSYNPGNPNNWAQGPPSGFFRNGGDQSQGVRITSGIIQFNQAPVDPLGFRTLGINWDYQNVSGQPTRSFRIRTRGTDNITPAFHYDNNGPRQFMSFATAPVGVNNKDDLLHTWSNPNGGDIPAAQLLHVGLEQDVWDWTVVSAVTVAPGGATTAAPLVGFHDWNHTIVIGTPAAAGEGIGRGGQSIVLACGFRMAMTDIKTRVNMVGMADVTGMNLRLEDLNGPMLKRLQETQRFIPLREFQPRDMEAGSDFFFVLKGKEEDLPPKVREQRNFMLLNRPDLVGRELFLVADTETPEAKIGSYALIGTPIIGQFAVPKLEIFRLPDRRVRICWPNPSDGYVLQCSRSLAPASWIPVTAPVEIIGGKKCVTLPTQTPMQFYRLCKQDNQLPVYKVIRAGITLDEAANLAEALKIPREQLAFEDGFAMFLDPLGFQAIPTTPITDPALIRELTDQTENDNGQLAFRGINFGALRQMRPISDSAALSMTEDALRFANVLPQNGSPFVKHSLFDAVDPKGEPIVENAELDTQVHYRFDLNGIPLIGPGAQLNASFSPEGKPTALLHSLRQVEPSDLVPIIPLDEAVKRCGALYPHLKANADPALIYYAPALSMKGVETLVPCYECGGTAPKDGQNVSLLRSLIPATDDARFVPAVQLDARAQGTVVFARALVNGGLPPYSYQWLSSSADLSQFPADASSIEYQVANRARLAAFPETLRVIVIDANGVQVHAEATMDISSPGLAMDAEEEAPTRQGVMIGGVTDFGCERGVSDLGAANQSGFVNRFLSEGVSKRFNWSGLSAWERDFKEGPTGLDHLYTDNADIVFYIGHGWGGGITFESSQDDGDLLYTDVVNDWGNVDLEWMSLLSCEVLAESTGGKMWYQRWSPAFNGLHLLLGFETTAYDWHAFGGRYADYMLGRNLGFATLPPFPVRTSWFQAKAEEQPSSVVSVVMGVIGPSGISNYDDYFWGQGPVGPDLRGTNIRGYWRVRYQ